MNRQKLLSILCCFFASFLAMLNGCSKPNLPIGNNEPLPPIIKSYKHTAIVAGIAGMKNTGVFVDRGEPFTIMATGRIDYCPGKSCGYHNVKPEDGWPVMAKIGKDGLMYRPLSKGRNTTTDVRYDSGYLFLGYKDGKVDWQGNALNPEYYEKDTGSFSIDIIVWKKEDYVQIASFFEKMKAKDPNNKIIRDALESVNPLKDIQLAKAEASKEADETQKMIKELKKEAQKSGPANKIVSQKPHPSQDKIPTADGADQKKIKILETKLAQLRTTLAQLDEMKRQLEEEKKKTARLTQEVEERGEREKALLSKIEDGAKNPPVLVIASPSDGENTESKAIQLSGVAEDNDGIERIEILINNQMISKERNRGIKPTERTDFSKRFDFSERIPLEKGTNQIKIRAVDTEGLYAERVLTIYRIEKRRTIWAVVIGINDYSNIRKLKYAVNDAKAFYELLVSHNNIPKENVALLLDRQANLTNLRSTLGTRLKKNADKDDTVFIYFAGHGATERDVMSQDGDGLEKYLLPYDADLKDLYSSALPMREISHIFNRIRSERLIFIADSCYSGASGGRTVSFSGIRANISNEFLDRIAGGKGTVILSASGANEVSAENEDFQHGIFTYYLLEGLRGKADSDKDGLVTVDEVYRYVSEQVPRATNQEQHPVKKGTVEGRLILGTVP